MDVFTCGIDLGTTFSCLSVSKNGVANVVQNPSGKRTMPSYVTFLKDNEVIVGESSKSDISKNIKNTVYDAKRLIGHKFSDRGVQEDIPHWNFKVIDDGSDNPLIQVEVEKKDVQYTPQDVSSFVLKELGKYASKSNKLPPNTTINAVITVPAYFNDNQRRATLEAGSRAGLNVLQIINEPTAAAIAYGYKYVTEKSNRTILIYDFGGGTFDVSIIEVKENNIQVKGTDGDTHLGGEDINSILVNYYAEKIEEDTGTDIRNNPKKIQRLRKACEDAKCLLSELNEAEVNFSDLVDNGIDNSLTRALLNNLCKEIFNRTIDIVARTLSESHLSKSDIDDVVLIGGSSRILKVQEMLREFFDGKKLNQDINPDEAVAIGASILAEDLIRGTTEKVFNNGSRVLVDDRGDFVGQANEIEPPSSAFPNRKKGPKVRLNASGGKKVRLGADAGFREPISNPRARKIRIEDVLSQSLGERVVGDKMIFMLKKNQSIPCEYSEVFFTVRDNQDKIPLCVYQGENKVASQNTKLYDGMITGLPLKPAGQVKFNDTFRINANGILIVSAEETTGTLEPFVVTINI